MYELILSRGAVRDLRGLRQGSSAADRDAIDRAIQTLAEDPRPAQARRLVNSDLWRLRVRDYRIIFAIDDDLQTIHIFSVARRGESTYRNV